MDILTTIRTSPMRGPQILIIISCFIVMLIDGFDIFVMAFLVPFLPEGFLASDAQRGLILSAGLIGMGTGALLLTPLADRIGRKRLSVILTAMATIGMLCCGFAQNFEQLFAARILTGLGVGAIGPLMSLLVQEYSSDKRRTVAFGFFALGFPGGVLVSGIFALSLLRLFNNEWHSMFFFGAGLGVICLLLTIFAIPESAAFLMTKEPESVQPRLEKIARRLKVEGVDTLARPVVSEAPDNRGALRAIFSKDYLPKTVVIVFLFSVSLFGYYWLNSWTPQLVATQSGSPEAGALAGTILGLGGVLGAILFTLLSIKFNPFRFHGIFMTIAAAAFVGVAFSFSTPAISLPLIALGGLLLQTGLTTYGAAVVPFYAVNRRATVLGVQGFVSRVAGILAPIVVGLLLAFLAPWLMYALVGIPILIGAVGGFYITRKLGSRPAALAAAPVAAKTDPALPLRDSLEPVRD